MGCFGSRVSPLEVTSPIGSRTADHTPPDQPGTVNEEAHSAASTLSVGAVADQNTQDDNNVRENHSERSIRMSDGANRTADVRVQRSVEDTLAADERPAEASKDNNGQASDETGSVKTDDKGHQVPTTGVHPSTSGQRALRSPDHSNSHLSSHLPYQSVRVNVGPTVDGNSGDNRNPVAASNRHACDQNTSTTDLQPNHAVQEQFPEVVYRERIVEVPQVSNLDIVVQASKYLEHTLIENFSAEGVGLENNLNVEEPPKGRENVGGTSAEPKPPEHATPAVKRHRCVKNVGLRPLPKPINWHHRVHSNSQRNDSTPIDIQNVLCHSQLSQERCELDLPPTPETPRCHSDIDLAVHFSKRIEHRLKSYFGAQGNGLHDLLKSARHRDQPLPVKIRKNVLEFAYWRNSQIHDLQPAKRDQRVIRILYRNIKIGMRTLRGLPCPRSSCAIFPKELELN